MQATEPKPPAGADDKPFQHYSVRHRITAWVSTHLFDHVTYTAQHGLIAGMKRKGGLGWVPKFLSTAIHTPEEEFWRGLDFTAKIVYDVGAFQGLLTLYFASKARQVISYEPNRQNRTRLEENIRLNRLGNVLVRPVGLSSARSQVEMVFDPLMPAGASIESTISAQIRRSNSPVKTEQITVTTLDADRSENNLPPPDFLKIDIEGLELEALKGARDTVAAHHPELFLEMHGETVTQKVQKVTAIVEFLHSAGYSNITHIESGSRITPANSAAAAEGHLYCRF